MKRPIFLSIFLFFLMSVPSANAYLKEILAICETALLARHDIILITKQISTCCGQTDEKHVNDSPASGQSTEPNSDILQQNRRKIAEEQKDINGLLHITYQLLAETEGCLSRVGFLGYCKETANKYIIDREYRNFNVSNVWLTQLSAKWAHIAQLSATGLEKPKEALDEDCERKMKSILARLEPIFQDTGRLKKSNSGRSLKNSLTDIAEAVISKKMEASSPKHRRTHSMRRKSSNAPRDLKADTQERKVTLHPPIPPRSDHSAETNRKRTNNAHLSGSKNYRSQNKMPPTPNPKKSSSRMGAPTSMNINEFRGSGTKALRTVSFDLEG